MNTPRKQYKQRAKNAIVTQALLSIFFLSSAKDKEQRQSSHIANYSQLSPQEQQDIETYIQSQEQQERYKAIPEEDRIPRDFIRISKSPKEIHPIPNFYQIYFLPNKEFAFELMKSYQEKKNQYKENTPPQLLVLAQMSKESCLQQVIGDDGKSHGMCQLYKPTAESLLRKPEYKETFQKLFKINQKGDPEFFGQKEQFDFMFDYLVQVCGFGPGKELQATTNYNDWKGYTEGEKIPEYTQGVLKRYSALILFDLYCKNKEKSIQDLLQEVGPKIQKEFPGINKGICNDLVHNNEEIQKFISQKNLQQTQKITTDTGELAKEENPMSGDESYLGYAPDIAGTIVYILKKDIFTMYSVFQEQYREAMEYHNNQESNPKEKISFYTLEYIAPKKKYIQKPITTKQEIHKLLKKGKEIRGNMPDTIYIKPGMKIYNYKKLPPYPIYVQQDLQRNSGISH